MHFDFLPCIMTLSLYMGQKSHYMVRELYFMAVWIAILTYPHTNKKMITKEGQ